MRLIFIGVKRAGSSYYASPLDVNFSATDKDLTTITTFHVATRPNNGLYSVDPYSNVNLKEHDSRASSFDKAKEKIEKFFQEVAAQHLTQLVFWNNQEPTDLPILNLYGLVKYVYLEDYIKQLQAFGLVDEALPIQNRKDLLNYFNLSHPKTAEAEVTTKIQLLRKVHKEVKRK